MGERQDYYRNRRALLLRLLDSGNATKQNLVQWTSLSNTTVSDTINGMLKTGFVIKDGMQNSIGGRRSVIYSINAGYGQFAGIELTAACGRAVLCDACGRCLDSLEVARRSGEPAISLLYRTVDAVLALPFAENLLAIGVGVEGRIDYPTQTVVKSDVFAWQNVPLKELVERRVYLPVVIDSAINGQISLRKYLEGESCPPNYLVLNGGFARKATLCLDGRICRGKDNLCGTADGFFGLLDQAGGLVQTLSLEKVWVACVDPGQLQEAQARLGDDVRPLFELYVADAFELAWGLALEVETKWFGTIYTFAPKRSPGAPP